MHVHLYSLKKNLGFFLNNNILQDSLEYIFERHTWFRNLQKQFLNVYFICNENGHLDREFQNIVYIQTLAMAKKITPASKLLFKTNDFIFYSVTSDFH